MWSEAGDWLARARRLVPREDRKVLLSPPRLVARLAWYAVRRATGRAGRARADDPAARDPELIALLLELGRALARHYFRLRVEGIEHVPPRGPVLLVGNHSGGFVPSEGVFIALAIADWLGPERVVHALAHDFLFEDPTLRRYAARLGLLRAGHTSARRAFAAGACVLVFPGSDMDTFRPFRDRNQVVLAGRTGFIKLALREGVPIVPVVTAGTHEQLVVLARGDRLARRLGAHRWGRTEVLPIVLALPWGVTLGFLPYLPLPAQTTVAFLPAMRWPDLGPADAERPDVVARCYREVEAAMQAELDRITRGRRLLVGQRVTPRGLPRAEQIPQGLPRAEEAQAPHPALDPTPSVTRGPHPAPERSPSVASPRAAGAIPRRESPRRESPAARDPGDRGAAAMRTSIAR